MLTFLKNQFFRFYKFPNYIESTTFGISCDAFANLKETLTRHKPMVAEYLDKNYDRASDVPIVLDPYANFFQNNTSSFYLLRLLFFRITT